MERFENLRIRRKLSCLFQYFSKCNPQTIYFRISRVLLEKADSWAHPNLLEGWPGICIEQTLVVSLMQTKARRAFRGESVEMN